LKPEFSIADASVLITGASAGLGVEFANQLAPRVKRLLLVARREDALNEVRRKLIEANPRVDVLVFAADISTAAGREQTLGFINCHSFALNLLINNAGVGDYGDFATAESDRIQNQIDLNVTALVQLTHSLLPILKRNQPSAILNVSSIAGELPRPSAAIYAASKAFVTCFSESLRIELQGEGISVTTVCPGPTPTSFSQAAKRPDGKDIERSGEWFLKLPKEAVVAQALRGLEGNVAAVYPGFGVRTVSILLRCLPRWMIRRLLSRRHKNS
jgi:short-subunit dehydrogenase